MHYFQCVTDRVISDLGHGVRIALTIKLLDKIKKVFIFGLREKMIAIEKYEYEQLYLATV